MQIWIDIEDASGRKYGDGPIMTATGWSRTWRLDQAGTFSFQMPAADPRASLLRQKRVVRAWGVRDGRLEELGAGIVEQIELDPQPNGTTMLRVKGDDLLRELTYRSVGELDLLDIDSITPWLSVVTTSGTTPLSLPAVVNLSPDPLRFLYIECDETYTAISLTISGGNTTECEVSVQYKTVTEAGEESWQTVPELDDGTLSDGRPLAGSGTISFGVPAGWGRMGNGRYAVRISSQEGDLTAFTITAASVQVIRSTADALERVMALAPVGWSLDPAGELATADDVLLRLNGETALATLGRLAQQTGEHFILAPSGRRVRWLGAAQRRSNLQAVAASDPSDHGLRIISLTRTEDSYDLATRLYVYGGGQGQARVTLAQTTRTAPAGWTLNEAESYLEVTAAVGEYGRIDRREMFSDITPVDISSSAMVAAANTLFDRAVQLLSRLCQVQTSYSLRVAPCRYPLLPGQLLPVSYHEWVDGYHSVDIDDELWVLETQTEIDEAGVATVALQVATVDMWSANDYRVVARALDDTVVQRAIEIPENGLNSEDAGTVVFLAVRSGSVVDVRRVQPIADGQHFPIDYITTVGGVVVEAGILYG